MKSIEFGPIKKVKVAISDPSEPRNMRAIAVLSWRSLIVLAILWVLASLALGFLKFESTLRMLDDANAPTVGAKAKFNRAYFDTIVSGFRERELRYRATKAAPPAIADPSS